MFKAARWRNERNNKIKAVFKLQFQATQIPQSEWNKITVSLIPVDVGKPTVKSDKADVADGACRWEKPIYETVKFVQEPKTGRFNEKIYHFLVSATGSPKAALVGEATFDFAAYSEAIKPSTVSLPLKALNSSAILHVTVQRMHEDVFNGRESEENGDTMVKPHRQTLRRHLIDRDKDEATNVSNGTNCSNTTEQDNSLFDGQARQKFPSSRTVPLHAESNENLKKSSSSDALSAFGSEGSSGHYTPKENGLQNHNIHQDLSSFLSPLSNDDVSQKPTTKVAIVVTDNGDYRRSNTEWSVSSNPDGSIDGSTNSSDESGLGERMQTSDVYLEKLRNEVVVLSRQVEVSELELQALRKQVVKEKRQGQDMSRELHSLKEERDSLRIKWQQLKKKNFVDETIVNRSQYDVEGMRSRLEEIIQELNHEKNMNANLCLQLQKTQQSNSELILAVRDLDELLEKKNIQTCCIDCNQVAVISASNVDYRETKCKNGSSWFEKFESNEAIFRTISANVEDEEQYALEELVKEKDMKGAYSHEQKIADLNSEIELYKRDHEELEMQIEQISLDYEILKQENHNMSSKLEQTQLREQLRMQYECSAHLSIINDLEAHLESLEKELEKQAEEFEADLAYIIHAKFEQEQRAIQAEEALRKIRWNNANAAERIQEEFKRLSAQMSSMLQANQNLAKQTMTETSELRLQKKRLEELFEQANEELGLVRDQCRVKLEELASQICLKTKQTDQLLMKLNDKSQELENHKKSEEARHGALSEEVSMLKAKIEMLVKERNSLSEQLQQNENLKTEMEQLKMSIKISEMLLQDKSMNKDVVERDLASVREEAKKLQEELNDLRHVKDEKETMIRTLNSELGNLRAQCYDLKHSGFEDELAKEDLREQVLHLTGDLQKKKDIITSMEKKLEDTNTRIAVADGISKTAERNINSKSGPATHGSLGVTSLYEKIKFLEGERTSKDAALEDSKHSFFAKEKELSDKIEELGKVMEELNQNGDRSLCVDDVQKNSKADKKSTESVVTNCKRNSGEYLMQPEIKDEFCRCHVGSLHKPIFRNIGSHSKMEVSDDEVQMAQVLSNIRERNESMEAELKEMQERYSEISLKFAEVEGERQQLVMTIRALKNSVKG